MANWTPVLAARDGGLPNPTVEATNAVAYVNWNSDDNRSVMNVRTPYAVETDLLNYLAQEAQRRSAVDDQIAAVTGEVAATALVGGQPIALPDISGIQAVQAAQTALNQKIAAAQLQGLIAVDPTIADAQGALSTAQAAVTARVAQAKLAG